MVAVMVLLVSTVLWFTRYGLFQDLRSSGILTANVLLMDSYTGSPEIDSLWKAFAVNVYYAHQLPERACFRQIRIIGSE